jgi:hypothetical protein
MVHCATYAPTPQHIDFHLHIALSTPPPLGMYLWYANFTNIFAEAERPNQIYYIRWDRVF